MAHNYTSLHIFPPVGDGGPICKTDLLSREVRCLLGAQIWDAVERLLRLVQSLDYYPFLLIHMQTDDPVRSL